MSLEFGYSPAPSAGTRGSLRREGVLPSTGPNARLVPNSKFGRGSVLNHRGTDQQQTRAGVVIRPYSPLESITAHAHLTLPRPEWIPLGDGWFQATPRRESGGSSSRCGLHSVIDGSLGLPLLCIYEPRSAEAIASCINAAEFDLEVSAKVIQSNEKTTTAAAAAATDSAPAAALRRVSLLDSASISASSSSSSSSFSGAVSPQALNFQILFAFQSLTDFMLVTADVSTQSWVLSRVRGGEETVLEQVGGHDIRPNQFYHVLVQVRGGSVSVDVNATPIITAARIGGEEESLGGLLGCCPGAGASSPSRGGRYVEWQSRGPSASLGAG